MTSLVENNEKSNIDNTNVILDSDTILQIIADIQSEKIPSMTIRKKYNLSKYRFYKIINDYHIRTPSMTRGPRVPTGPRNTPFKKLIHGTPEEQKAAKILPENFNVNHFIEDCTTTKLTISELMSKYNLSLYQVRELRIAYDVKTK
jgi:hypothetical protein